MAPHLDGSAHDLVGLGRTERRELDLSKLRCDLAALWQDEGHGVVKACHATLVLSVTPATSADPLLDEIVRGRPSRVVLLAADPSLSPGEMEAWATGSCFRGPDGESLICSEMIQLSVGSQAQTRVASVIRSLTVGGMPLDVLVLSGSPRSLPWLDSLGAEVDRVLFRSDTLELREAVGLWERCVRDAAPPRAEDVTWTALEGWRGVVASRFDGVEAGRLADLSEVRLRISGSGERPQAALLMAGWLASRLGWQPANRGPSPQERSFRTPAGGRVQFVVEGGGPAFAESGLLRVEFHYAGEGTPWVWNWFGEDRLWKLEGMPQAGPRIQHALPEDASGAWLRVLRRRHVDPVAAEAMRMAHRLGSA